MGRVSVGGQVPATLDRVLLLDPRGRWTYGSVGGRASKCGTSKCIRDRCPPHLIGYTYSIPVRDGRTGRSVGE